MATALFINTQASPLSGMVAASSVVLLLAYLLSGRPSVSGQRP